MHREDAVVLIGGQELLLWLSQLIANEEGFDTAHAQEENGHHAVHEADLLVVDCGDP